MIHNTFCGCCDASVDELASKTLEERLQGTQNDGMKEILLATSLNDLGNKGHELVDWCIDFLLVKSKIAVKKKHPFHDDPHKEKYITIWSFIYDFLEIPKDSGYDYWLMSFLEWNDIMEHFTSIRCGYLKNESKYPKATERRQKMIFEWADTCHDYISEGYTNKSKTKV